MGSCCCCSRKEDKLERVKLLGNISVRVQKCRVRQDLWLVWNANPMKLMKLWLIFFCIKDGHFAGWWEGTREVCKGEKSVKPWSLHMERSGSHWIYGSILLANPSVGCQSLPGIRKGYLGWSSEEPPLHGPFVSGDLYLVGELRICTVTSCETRHPSMLVYMNYNTEKNENVISVSKKRGWCWTSCLPSFSLN